jgi:hypothetical protein
VCYAIACSRAIGLATQALGLAASAASSGSRAVTARPGPESVGLGGLLYAFRRAGTSLGLLCLTRGEASPLNSTCARLEAVRPWELQLAASVLGISRVVVASYPDRGLCGQPAAELTGRIRRAIREQAADLLLVPEPAGDPGIGDYLDEEAGHDLTGYLLTVPPQDLATTEQYLAVLGGHPAKFRPGERFSYCNSGYVVLALIAERISGVAFDQLVAERVCGPGGMADTGFLRSDELPAGTALGYLPIAGRSRTNVFHLPVRGSGDGGIYSTAADISALWQSLFAGRIVPARWVAEMVRPRSDVPAESRRYGLGFWLGQHSDTVILEGFDAGVSFRSVHDPRSAITRTVISNSSDGAWPIARRLDEFLAG